jgi:hypothetical protein
VFRCKGECKQLRSPAQKARAGIVTRAGHEQFDPRAILPVSTVKYASNTFVMFINNPLSVRGEGEGASLQNTHRHYFLSFSSSHVIFFTPPLSERRSLRFGCNDALKDTAVTGSFAPHVPPYPAVHAVTARGSSRVSRRLINFTGEFNPTAAARIREGLCCNRCAAARASRCVLPAKTDRIPDNNRFPQ